MRERKAKLKLAKLDDLIFHCSNKVALKLVHSGDNKFDFLVYTAWLYTGAALHIMSVTAARSASSSLCLLTDRKLLAYCQLLY